MTNTCVTIANQSLNEALHVGWHCLRKEPAQQSATSATNHSVCSRYHSKIAITLCASSAKTAEDVDVVHCVAVQSRDATNAKTIMMSV